MVPLRAVATLIEVRDLTREYEMGEERIAALAGVSFSIDEGEMVAIVGTSGSGKTTLLHILGCLETPSGGSYRLRGRDVQGLDDDERSALRNREIGFVFQNFQLLARAPAWKNVALPLVYRGVPARQREKQAVEALGRVGLADRLGHRPNQLSGGQRQRVAIARALVAEPSLLLADEPTGNLDTRTGEEIMALFAQISASGRSIVVVTHEEEVAARSRRIVRLRDGKIESDLPVAPQARTLAAGG